MVIFDCEKMKCPNTGLYRFCESLGHSLMEKIRTEPDMTLAFYTPKSVAGAILFEPFSLQSLPVLCRNRCGLRYKAF